MCGIAGVMTHDGVPPDGGVLDRLAQALDHRGVDGRGRHVAADVGMIHDRLAIIDLAGGDQPLAGPGGTALVANGEIYNFVELRAELGERGFATRSDCEPPLHLYAREGSGFTDRLRGMYAIALHDAPAGRLLLARDPFGIKPLYYAETPAGLAFASEPQALIAAGLVAPGLDLGARDDLLQFHFSTGANTAFRGISRLLPGEILVAEAGRIIDRRRRAALPQGGPARLSEADALVALDAALMDSVEVHQRADVAYGLFLSGGIDSAVLLAAMARLNDRPIRTFTAGFAGSGVADERAHAHRLADVVGAEHVEVEVTEDDLWNLLPEIATAVDEPIADYALLPTYKLAREAAHGLKVVLTGEGGDELFAGYGRYRRALRPRWRGGRAMRTHGVFDGLDLLRAKPFGRRERIAKAKRDAAGNGRSHLQVLQAVDCANWLPNDLLIKLDRCLMAFGVEGRTPFLDPVVADLALRLPDSLKLRRGMGKWLLRLWLERHLPEARPFSHKRGFSVPVADWMTRRGHRLGWSLARDPAIEEICLPGVVERLFEAPGLRSGVPAWTLLFYALWHRRHIRGLAPDGDVFDCLAVRG